tara:strand:- start:2820 stop:3644 length:825 start_codon:yes stop_codon:yes gene_type:complete
MKKGELFNLKKGFYIVTGGMGLMGQMHCEVIAEYGGTPVIFDINSNGFESFKKKFKKYTLNEPIFIKTDITDESSIQNSLDLLRKKDKKVYGLINNAARNPKVSSEGLEESYRLENFDIKEWEKDLKVGLTGAFICTKIIGTYMNNNDGGSIINISSDLGIIAPNQNIYKKDNLENDQQFVKPVSYSVIKSGMVGLTKYTSTYWPLKVRCNCLCPGGIYTDQTGEFLNKIKELIPMQRMANKNEYKGSIIFLLSNASSYMNGSIISIDGGRTAW